MASLARITRSKFSVPRALIARRIQTSADTTKLSSSSDEVVKVTLHEESFHSYKCETPGLDVEVTKENLLKWYTQMNLMRRMEMAADTLYKAKFIRGFCHLAIGQEAVAVGLESAIAPEDRVITAYRCHPFAVLRGGTIKGVLAELLGRQAGMSHGKGGSMHIFTPSFYGGNGIVGAQVPVGAGLAFAQKYLGQNNVATFAMYGDGASNQGQVFEAFNMAKLWNLPCVFVCENNKYGMGTSAERSSSNTQYFTRGDQIPGIQANGMDIIASHQAVKFAKEWVTSGNGPLLLEFVTYRYGGHSMSDPGTTYRTREEIQRMRSTQDPIRGLAQYIQDWGVASEEELKEIEKQARTEIDQAVDEAKASPLPEPRDLWTDIYPKGSEPPFMRGREREERISGTILLRHFASSSKNTLDNPKSSTSQSVMTVYDAPSQPSEHLTRRSARSQHSLTDYFASRNRLSSRSTRQVSSSTSNAALENTSTKQIYDNQSPISRPSNVQPETFDSPSRPQAYYARPQRKADTRIELPVFRSRYVLVAVLTALGLSAWGGFVLYATNMERLSSSVVRRLSTDLKNSNIVAAALGEGVHLEPKWWLAGEPWIEGAINMLQGKVDLRFRIVGSGTVYFTSIREEKGRPFVVLRYKLICDNGQVLRLNDLSYN
ncbi:hypothetical protein Clacol_006303 [Clathrus columnatus]|uniref:Pyruvate dehydrogenase E1 component subunit alpha n=1 Tax=Clathrus columnatus TaxID=1419009 RepID=A0AAV5ABP4_9AGAM|nr:hypothetical protein Clacol_006303 [Clathrus columnatus]